MRPRTILGHLAQYSAFAIQGEVLCTQGLGFLLQREEARMAFARLLSERTECPVDATLTWHTERRQEDGGRPDLEALDVDRVPHRADRRSRTVERAGG